MRPDGRRWEDDFLRQFGPLPRRVNPFAFPWRWRYELAVGVGAPVGLDALADATHPAAAVALALTAVVGGLGWVPARRVLVERARCVFVQHRLRAAMAEAGIHAWSGRWLPTIVRTTPVDRGVRVVLWCHAGVGISRFVEHREELASACWAQDVEVSRHPGRANVVVLLVVTRAG
jgi:hypothetical protein